jgi:tetratricopeptide (TPR) repeat protein
MQAAVGDAHPDVAIVLHNLGNLELATGDHAAARASFGRALAIHEKAGRSNHPTYAQSLAGLAEVDLAANDGATAKGELERAVVIFGASEGTQEGELPARFALAKAIVATGGDRARALAEARAARDGYRSVGAGQAEAAAAVDAWLAEHGADP